MPAFDLSLDAAWDQIRGLLQTELESLHAQLDQFLTVAHAADGTLNPVTSAAFTRAPVVITTTATGAQHNFDISSANGAPLLLRCNNTASLDFTGFRGGQSGQLLTIISVAANEVTFSHQDALSAGPNRLGNQATVGLTRLVPNANDSTQRGVATYLYDINGNANNAGIPFWRLLNFDQGNWRIPTYSAGDFTTSPGSWTVEAGDIATGAIGYYLRGRALTFAFSITSSSVIGAVNTDLYIGNGQWGGFKSANAGVIARSTGQFGDNGTPRAGVIFVVANDTKVGMEIPSGGSWAASVNNTHVAGQLTFEVQ